jgi:hypothetical protein
MRYGGRFGAAASGVVGRRGDGGAALTMGGWWAAQHGDRAEVPSCGDRRGGGRRGDERCTRKEEEAIP